MIWLLVAVVLIVVAMTQRATPVRAVIITLLVGLLGTAIYFRLQIPPAIEEQSNRTAPAPDIVMIPLADIQTSNLEMTGTGAPWNLTGTITNQSSRDLWSFIIAVTRLDCYPGALDASGCVTLWKGEQLVSLNVPAQASRNFAVAIRTHRAIAPRGETRDSFEITRAVGR